MFEITFVFRDESDESFPQNPKLTVSKCNTVLMIIDDDMFGMNYLIF